MDETKNNENVEYNKESAKDAYERADYPLAELIYQKLWDESNKRDPYLLSGYGRSLRKNNNSGKFVEICRELDGNGNCMNDKYVVSNLCWCLYDGYIKCYNLKDEDGFEDFLKRAEYIVNHCEQKNADEQFITPYVLTVIKVVKIYKAKASVNYRKIIRWLKYLDADRLSEETFGFTDESGRDRELASKKEFYYANLAKALEKVGEYEECIKVCETVLKKIKKLHYRNHIWLKARMYYCDCMISDDVDYAIEKYKELAEKENFWFMYHKLSQVYFRYNKIEDALLYVCKAYLCIPEKMNNKNLINLFLDSAQLWQASGITKTAEPFFHASAYYRKKWGWRIPEELRYAVEEYSLNIDKKPDINKLIRFSSEYVSKIEGKKTKLEGVVKKILPGGDRGFIKHKQKEGDVFFLQKDVSNEDKLRKGDSVIYDMFKQKDGRLKAINIEKRG